MGRCQNPSRIGVNGVYNDLKNRKPSLTISKTVFINFSIRNPPMFPINEIKIRSFNDNL